MDFADAQRIENLAPHALPHRSTLRAASEHQLTDLDLALPNHPNPSPLRPVRTCQYFLVGRLPHLSNRCGTLDLFSNAVDTMDVALLLPRPRNDLLLFIDPRPSLPDQPRRTDPPSLD